MWSWSILSRAYNNCHPLIVMKLYVSYIFIHCFTEDDEMRPVRSAVWPTDIDNIPVSNSQAWLSGLEQNGHCEDPSDLAQGYRGMRHLSSTFQLTGNYNGTCIGNPNIPQSLRRVITSRNKRPNPGPSLSFHNIQYTVKRRRCNFTGITEPYPILKGIR